MKNRKCPICSSSKKTLLYKQVFHNTTIALMDHYDVVVCDQCGFAFADDIPSQQAFNIYYAEMSKYEFEYNEGVVSEDYERYFNKVADFLMPHIKSKAAKVLDIGCSTGLLLNIFKKNGYNHLLGVDPSSTCVKTVENHYHIKAIISNIHELKLNEKFDVIILSAVLEHIVDLKGTLRKISSLLNNKGLLFIEVPDVERFSVYITAPYQQFSIEHINYFSQHSIRNLLGTLSFQIIDWTAGENKMNLTIDPDLFVLARKENIMAYSITKDEVSAIALRKYLSCCIVADKTLKKRIQICLNGRGKIIVWGVGTHTQRLLGAGLDFKKILYFVDSNQRYVGKQLNGIEIKAPESIQEEGAPILISSYSYRDEISEQIRKKLNLLNEIIELY